MGNESQFAHLEKTNGARGPAEGCAHVFHSLLHPSSILFSADYRMRPRRSLLASKLRERGGTSSLVLTEMAVKQQPASVDRMTSNPAERRRSPRMRLQVPIFIRGVDSYGEEFLDLTKTLDISAVGAYLASPRPLKLQGMLTLTVPAPQPSTTGLVPAANAPIQARVRRLYRAGDVHLVGVEFLKPLD